MDQSIFDLLDFSEDRSDYINLFASEQGYKFGGGDPGFFHLWYEAEKFWVGQSLKGGEPNRLFSSYDRVYAQKFWLLNIARLYGGWVSPLAQVRYPQSLDYLSNQYDVIALEDGWFGLGTKDDGRPIDAAFKSGFVPLFQGAVAFSYVVDMPIADLVNALRVPGALPRPELRS